MKNPDYDNGFDRGYYEGRKEGYESGCRDGYRQGLLEAKIAELPMGAAFAKLKRRSNNED